jgi:hypothetical protein
MIYCELYTDTLSEVSDNNDNQSLDSDSETSTEEQENSELESYDDKTSDMWFKTDKKPNTDPFFGTTGLNIVTDNPELLLKS